MEREKATIIIIVLARNGERQKRKYAGRMSLRRKKKPLRKQLLNKGLKILWIEI